MNIKDLLISSLGNISAVHVADTYCYNIHRFRDKSKTSALRKKLATLPALADNEKYFVVVGAIGRTQHSRTDLHIFKVDQSVLVGSTDVNYRDFWSI